MSDKQPIIPEGINLNEYINQVATAKATNGPTPLVPLDQFITGDANASIREQIRESGVASYETAEGTAYLGVDLDSGGHVMAVAATVPRTPSRASDFLKEVSDFKASSSNRKDQIGLYRRIYEAEGLVNNAIQKVAALIATDVRVKLRRVKGVRGKGTDKRADEVLTLVRYWMENLNSPTDSGVATGGRGIQSFFAQGVRTALIEGGHFSRTNWTKVKVPVLKGKSLSLPMNIQTFGGDVIEIPEEAAALNIDWIDWVPPKKLIDSLSKPKRPEMKKEIDALIPPDVQAALVKDGRYRLDSSLVGHVKHRGQMTTPYGESFIAAAMSSIAYKRALQALDIVTIENLINRLLILKVGSDNPNSVYHKQEVTARRVTLLQNMMRKIGPSSTLVWAGPDLALEEAGAHGQIMNIDGRYELANSMIRADLGTPSSLLTGEGQDGKASALAAIIAVGAQIRELQNEYGQLFRTWIQRIASENGYEDVDVTVTFAPNPLINRTETTSQLLQGYSAGVVPIRVLIEDGYGADFETWEQMMHEEVDLRYRDEPFGKPKAQITTNPAGTDNGGGGEGRPPNERRPGKPDPRKNKEKEKVEEHK